MVYSTSFTNKLIHSGTFNSQASCSGYTSHVTLLLFEKTGESNGVPTIKRVNINSGTDSKVCMKCENLAEGETCIMIIIDPATC
jgi:hypothetical protein